MPIDGKQIRSETIAGSRLIDGTLTVTQIDADNVPLKLPVVAATTTSGTLASDFEDSDVIDGITLSTGDRILIKDQGSSENGIYTVNASGAPTRATDLPSGAQAAGIAVFVQEGTANGDTMFLCTDDDGSDVVGTDTLTFVSYGITSLTEGDGIDITGSTISAEVGDGVQIGGGVGAATAINIDVSDFAGTGLEDDGSENLRIAASAAGDGLNGGSGSALSVDAGDGLQIGGGVGAATALNIDVSDFAGNGLEDDGSENLSLSTTVTVTYDDVAGTVISFPVGTTGQGAFATGTPVDDTHIANKLYVDSVAQGLDVKLSVRASTVDTLDDNSSISGSPTYTTTAGASGRGQITATLAVSGTFTVDGVTLVDDDRLLVKNEDETTVNGGLGGDANGIYVVSISGTSLTLDRAEDFDEDDEVTAGAFTFVEEGTVCADCGFVLVTDDPITIGGASGTALEFTQFSGAGQITAGDGLTKSGNTLDVVAGDGIVVAADSVAVDLVSGASALEFSGGDLRINVDSTNDSTVINGSDELVAAHPDDSDLDLTPAVASAAATDTTLDITNVPVGAVVVKVNGVTETVADGDGERTTAAFYFSTDGGTTALAFGSITAGASLYVNAGAAEPLEYDLAATDRIDICYDSTAA